MKEIQIFKNEQFGEIRVKDNNGQPWLCLNDVCRILEISNSRDCKSRLNQDGVVITDTIDSLGRTQQANFINESNLYKVIFQSRKPEAEKFTEWVTSEVLPSIRKHGAYMTEDTLEKALTSPDFLIRLATELKTEKEQRQLLEEEKKANASKVLFADAVSTSHTSILIGELSKLIKQNGLDIGEKRLFKYLRENGYLIKRNGTDYNMPTQRSVELGVIEVKERTINNPDGSIRITKTPKVTGKGQQYFINKFLNEEG